MWIVRIALEDKDGNKIRGVGWHGYQEVCEKLYEALHAVMHALETLRMRG